MQTVVAPASQSPIWNATLTFSGVSGAELAGRSLQVTLWDLCPQSEPYFMGECTVRFHDNLNMKINFIFSIYPLISMKKL